MSGKNKNILRLRNRFLKDMPRLLGNFILMDRNQLKRYYKITKLKRLSYENYLSRLCMMIPIKDLIGKGYKMDELEEYKRNYVKYSYNNLNDEYKEISLKIDPEKVLKFLNYKSKEINVTINEIEFKSNNESASLKIVLKNDDDNNDNNNDNEYDDDIIYDIKNFYYDN